MAAESCKWHDASPEEIEKNNFGLNIKEKKNKKAEIASAATLILEEIRQHFAQ